MQHRSGFVTVIGRPNVGKSTLINCFLGEKVAITSPKPQTTRSNLRAIITEQDYQIVLLDTPGIHKPQNKLGEYMMQSVSGALKDVDLILYLYDATEKEINPGDARIIEQLKALGGHTPVFLILNKIDLVPKENLLHLIEVLSQEYPFEQIIPVSARKADGLSVLREEIIRKLPEGPRYFPENISTDSTIREITREIIREKILFFTNEEVPHGVGIEIVQFKEASRTNRAVVIEANIYCEKATHKGILIGKSGAMLKRIGSAARRDIEKLTDAPVHLNLWVKVKSDWRNNPSMLKELGFED